MVVGGRKRGWMVASVVGVAVLAAAVGVARAAIPDANGVIHACYSKKGGVLRVSDSGACDRGRIPLSWNQAGVQGPAGPAGPPGPAGPTGSAGSAGSTGSAVRMTSITSTHLFTTTGFEKILSTNLPAGTYALTAHAVLTGSSGTTAGWQVACELKDGATRLGGARAEQRVEHDPNLTYVPQESLTVVGTVTVPAAGTEISLWCLDNGSGIRAIPSDYGAQLMSVKVGGSF